MVITFDQKVKFEIAIAKKGDIQKEKAKGSIAPEFHHFFAANLFNRLEVGAEFNSPVTNV